WFTTATSGNTLSDDGVSLSYPATFEFPLVTPTPSGSRVRSEPIANASNSRLLAQTIPLNVDGTVRYASALFRKNRANGATANDNILLEFADSGGNRRWGFGIEGAGDKPWLNANGSTTPSAGPVVTVGDTYFIVAKIVSSAAGVDTAYLKVFGTGYGSQVPANEPSTWDATLTESTGAILDRIRVRIDSANSAGSPGEVDDIRIANTWRDVVGTSEPTLKILQNPPDVIVAWPTNSGSFALQSLESLSTTNWTDVSTPPVVSGTSNTVTITNVSTLGFFRLKR
ncbi:MAG: Bacillopeptidase, partial [Verrucomicrobiales bacterium]|nr:Bacillopeptidase [Verrucomicrobiales bacterium]